MKRSAWRYLWSAREIRTKLLITFALLIIYRLVAHVPVPGADREAIAALLAGGGAAGTFVNLLDLLSGGTVSNFSVLAMGVYPYITAQIILQLVVPIIPALQRRMEENPREAQKWQEKWTYILAIPMAALQAFGQIRIFSNFAGVEIIPRFGFTVDTILPTLATIASMTAGTMFAIWLGELISEYGIRNQGLSLIIFSGIVSRIPVNFAQMMQDQENRWFILAFMIILTALIIAAIVFVQQGERRVPVIYPGRRVGRRMAMPVKNTLPLKVNMAGMIPLIFGQSILTFPGILASFFVNSETEWVARLALSAQNTFGGNNNTYWILYFLLVVFLTFFYTDVLFTQQNYGENLRRAGAQIQGVKPVHTQSYLTRVMRRITLPGALFLGIVAILPFLVSLLMPVLGLGSGQNSGLLVTSAGLLIVVGVVRDTFYVIEAELSVRGYDDAYLIR